MTQEKPELVGFQEEIEEAFWEEVDSKLHKGNLVGLSGILSSEELTVAKEVTTDE